MGYRSGFDNMGRSKLFHPRKIFGFEG
ncbi:unnamed protein product [Linum tenue]|uniref:Uncharacterized protein n=1 Tax=Linum tenue TaxID=586396 RepID=A0AAV0KG90_9ROSI|nr:unnamed protein product [Linum tenue]